MSEWNSNQPTPFFKVGEGFDCPNHGRTTILSIDSRLTRGTRERVGGETGAEPLSFGCLGLMLVAMLVIVVGCVAMFD